MTVPAVAYFNDALWEAFREFSMSLIERTYRDFAEEFRLPEALRAASERLFAEIKNMPTATGLEAGFVMDLYFDNFAAVMRLPNPNNNVVWKQLSQFIRGWEKKNGFLLRKGTLFYCWATERLFCGDFPNAFMRMHRALEEDNRRYGSQTVLPTASHRFISLRPKTDDTLYPITLEMIRFIVEALERYRMDTGGKLALPNCSSGFLKNGTRFLKTCKRSFSFSCCSS